ncbi:3-keto-disaccharide hydrolase [Neptunicella marina]|uniref:DUF1080 domain-containing protein n=1 Tax=Neptunicella marina TaxID=2125989 RepID=A0A8J6IWX1_9ALTE|nr:DUF1080 domain-containing protein [Neptunicella marina]MBC3767177.1 DUF1080 domain-containing protein [Neptunicella marina]
MKRTVFLLSTFFSSFVFTPLTYAEQWQTLLDKNLSQWDTYLSYKHKKSYDGSVPKDADGNPIAPIGLNTGNDIYRVFTVAEHNGEPVLRISGEVYGAITSKAVYRNYHLLAQFRWGGKKWPPRLDLLRDSGILYHAIGENGQEHFRTWMLSQEFQIMHGHVGDYWNQITSAMDVRAFTPEYIMNPIADESQPFLKVGYGENIKGLVLRKENAEKPLGEWNTVELICFEGQSLHIVNGKLVMVLKNSRYNKDGVTLPLDEGKIQIQSEAAEVFYKNIKIKQLDQMPEQYRQYF